MNKETLEGKKIKVKIQKKWIAAEVISHDSAEGWIELKSKNCDQYIFNIFIHGAHLKIPEAKPIAKLKKKRVRKPRKRKKNE